MMTISGWHCWLALSGLTVANDLRAVAMMNAVLPVCLTDIFAQVK